MASLFDAIQENAFGAVTNVFGHEASWVPSDGGDALPARVLFNDPTESQKYINPDYDPVEPMMEYHSSSFVGLKEAVDAGKKETVTIAGADFWVRIVTKHWDGKTYQARLARKST